MSYPILDALELSDEPTVAELAAAAVAFCRRICQTDFADVPLYVIAEPRCAAAEVFFGDTSFRGLAALHLDILLRDSIGDAWQGRGACVIVKPKRSFCEFAGELAALGERVDTRKAAEYTARFFLATTLHEVAHVLCDRWHLGLSAITERIDAPPIALACVESMAVEESNLLFPLADAFRHHGQAWHRTLAHVLHRAEAAGVDVAEFTTAGVAYGLGELADYMDALRIEATDFGDRPLGDLATVDAPAEYVLQFERDYTRLFMSYTPSEYAARRAKLAAAAASPSPASE